MAYTRVLSSSTDRTPTSPPVSPMRGSPMRRTTPMASSSLGKGLVGGGGRVRSLPKRIAWMLLSLLLRRQAIFLFAPLVYISGMLFYMGTVSLDVVPQIIKRPMPGSVSRSPQLYERFRKDLEDENSSDHTLEAVWRHPYRGGEWKPCTKASPDGMNYELAEISLSSHWLCFSILKSNYTTKSNSARWTSPLDAGRVFLIQMVTYMLRQMVAVMDNVSYCAFLVGLPDSNGYIYVEANGGLNQQRTSICNAVAVAGYLNATLIIPNFHFHSVWKDPSKFKDIYDEDHFFGTLKNDVHIVSKVPEFIMERYGHNMSNVYNFKIKAYSSIDYYKDAVLPKLIEEKLIRISPFANRLSPDAPHQVQRLRCVANYEALRFSNSIATFAESLTKRMQKYSVDSNGKYIAVHLRFEEDMVAFSCCVFDGGEQEKHVLNAARERGWRGKFTRPGRIIQPGAIRINGKCPLTPLEVGLMLRGMGFGNNTPIYLASGKIYNSEKTMVPLREMFPLLQTKETLASKEELAPFKNHSSRLAAIDYTVCLHSEVFVTTQGGNFPHVLIGHRRYLYGGHSKTIKPDKRKLALLFDNPHIGWKSFKRQLLNMRAHSDAKSVELRRPTDNLYTYPCPDCMCRLNKSEVSKSKAVT